MLLGLVGRPNIMSIITLITIALIGMIHSFKVSIVVYKKTQKKQINFSGGLKQSHRTIVDKMALPQYQEACDRFKTFIQEKSDWSPEMFLYPSIDLLHYVRDTLEHSDATQHLLTHGTESDMEVFQDECAHHANQLLPVILQNLIYLLYQKDCEEKPFSKTIIQWFRKKEWKFPLLPFEGGKKPEPPSPSPSTPSPTNNLNSSDVILDKVITINPKYIVKE